MKITILDGIYTDAGTPEFRTRYPRNLTPVPKQTGVNEGYLRPADGIELWAAGVGRDRGGIVWQGLMYRVQGSKLVRFEADGSITEIGDVADDGRYCTFDYGFDRLAIVSAGRLWYWTLFEFINVGDVDLGRVVDMVWVDGYYMTTDGEALIVTELTDATAVNPLKYGSSEADPDPVVALLKSTNEVYALNRNTIEVFENVGGNNFPFRRIDGAQIPRGVVGTHACCDFAGRIVFVGSGRNESPAVYLVQPGGSVPISTQEIDTILQGYTETQLAEIVCEARVDRQHQQVLIHLPDRTLVYDAAASQRLETAVWTTLDSGLLAPAQYRGRGICWAYGQWLVADPETGNIGRLTRTTSKHFGQDIGWEFGTPVIYNDSKGAIVHSMELVSLTGRVELGADPSIWTSYSLDGATWSMERAHKVGMQGDRLKRIQWRGMGKMESMRMQRFRGTSAAHISLVRLEAQLEPLNG